MFRLFGCLWTNVSDFRLLVPDKTSTEGGELMPKLGKKAEGHICTIECPYCAKIIDVIKDTEVISPAQKAEKKVTYHAEKSRQTSLSVSEP